MKLAVWSMAVSIPEWTCDSDNCYHSVIWNIVGRMALPAKAKVCFLLLGGDFELQMGHKDVKHKARKPLDFFKIIS